MKFTKKVLSNGLVVLFEKRDVPVTTVMLATKYGSEFELAEEKGVAHFIEHMAFKGTKKRSTREIAFELESVGGILNAHTAEEQTAFHVKLPSQHLNIAMDVIFDIFFNAEFPEEEVKKEGNVICEEIKMYNDSPQRYVLEKIKECLYKTPFGMFAAGTEETVRGLTREDLIKRHREVYCPENSILAVVGDNDFEEILELAEKYSEARVLGKKTVFNIEKQIIRKKETRAGVEQANLAIGFHIPYTGREKYAAQVFSSILGGGMSSKLFTEVREKRGLAYAVKCDVDLAKNYGYLLIYIGTDKEKVDEVIKICIEEFRKMESISEKELADGKMQVIGNYDVSCEDSENVALNLISEEIEECAEDYYKFEENINKVTLDEIKELSKIRDYAYFALVP